MTPDNGMHPTADTPLLSSFIHSGRRVMPSVRRLRVSAKGNKYDDHRATPV
jgi:hypothetical protein